MSACRVKWTFKRHWTTSPAPITARAARKLIGDYWFKSGRELACQIGSARFDAEGALNMHATGAFLEARATR